MEPFVERGTFLARTPNQLFYRTNTILRNGMCGGPVTEELDSSPFSEGKKTIVRGMLEGIVSPDHPITEIQGAAVFVESQEIREFLDKIEAEEVEPIIVGQIAAIVEADQDEEKMDLSKYLY